MNKILIDRAVVEQALEALEWIEPSGLTGRGGIEARNKAITALRAALAEPVQEQPTPAWWRDGLASTLMREGINKRRAREIADGYWQAYCKIGGNDD